MAHCWINHPNLLSISLPIYFNSVKNKFTFNRENGMRNIYVQIHDICFFFFVVLVVISSSKQCTITIPALTNMYFNFSFLIAEIPQRNNTHTHTIHSRIEIYLFDLIIIYDKINNIRTVLHRVDDTDISTKRTTI